MSASYGPAANRVVLKQAYLEALIDSCNQATATTNIIIASMSFDPSDPVIARLATAMIAATAKQAAVTLMIDHMTFYGPRASRQIVRSTLDELRAAGVRVIITNQRRGRYLLMVSGRSHMKFAVVGATVYIGGCNLEHADEVDVMIERQDAWLAGYLGDMVDAIADDPLHLVHRALKDTDVRKQLDQSTTLLIDAGRPHQSLILRTAIAYTKAAQQSIYSTCQYPLLGEAAWRLAAAAGRGVKVRHYYNALAMHRGHDKILYTFPYMLARLTTPAQYVYRAKHIDNYLHAKVLVIDSETTMVGSHNYLEWGVYFGTAEIALLIDDSQLSRDIVQKLDQAMGIKLTT